MVAPASRRCGGGASVITEAARDRATGTGTGTGKPERLSDDLTASGTDAPIKNTTPSTPFTPTNSPSSKPATTTDPRRPAA
jgi:hypothetical protein